ncbi:hypothetical protein BJ322DRAFT_675737 [Thelephora terrestris]|uniref:Uncharacterized protein n=1 Tax=Thelephora terrestris TaxID=56493 RepID=A0A9P6HH28_9AGAM|nr:hypothetical protein BJ322DRAFT_675737 [Thelephora terrestris]
MSSKESDQPSDPQPPSTSTPRFVGLRHLLRTFSTPDTKTSTIPSGPEPEPEPPRSDSPVDDEQPQTKDQDDAEGVASPTPLQRFWRHARTRTSGFDDASPSRWSAPEPHVTTEHASRSPTLSRSPSTAAEELDAVSSMPATPITPPEGSSSSTPLSEGEYPTPTSLAQRIHSIIASTPTATYQPMALESPTTPNDRRSLPQSPVQGPSNLLSPMADSRLLSFLHSPRLMNSPGLGQPSVFSVLERLQSPMSRNRELPPDSNDEQDSRGMEVADDGSSLMLCSPLIPQRDSLVEIAETEYVSYNEAGRAVAESYRSPLRQIYTVDDIHEESESDDGQGSSEMRQDSTVGDRGVGSSQTTDEDSAEAPGDGEGRPGDAPGTESRSIFRWPWSKTEEERRAEQKAKEEKQKAEAKAKEEQKLKKKNEKLVWVPSPINISLQTMWWGYRIYFPPPVLEVLNNKQLEAAKRAAMITSALQWLLDHVPVALIPPQFQLGLTLLRGLIPLLGYIGSFIAWSWSAIRVFDRGCGVTLTATWLLPIAIIPGTWQAYEVPATPQLTQGEVPSQPDPNETSNVVSVETQKEEAPVEKETLGEAGDVPKPTGSTSQKPDVYMDEAWGSSSCTSNYQTPQGYWDPSFSGVWVPPEHGYPNPMYSNSSSFYYAQSHYPPGAYFTPNPDYATPTYGYYQPVHPEQTPQMYNTTTYDFIAPPPVVMQTVPLPSSRPNTPPRRR